MKQCRALVVAVLASTALILSAASASADVVVDSGTESQILPGGEPIQFTLPIPSSRGLSALIWAGTQLGKPYRWGGVGPHSWDCSGLVQWAYRRAGVAMPRTTWEQAKVGTPVPFGALAPGDVVILNADGSHVGIYAGFGQVFNAFDNGVPVGLTPLRKFKIYAIRRL